MKYERMVEISKKIEALRSDINNLEPLTHGALRIECKTRKGGEFVYLREGDDSGPYLKEASVLLVNLATQKIARLESEIQQLESLTE